jgi:hypothetical protein
MITYTIRYREGIDPKDKISRKMGLKSGCRNGCVIGSYTK